jgi:hypothetical protein
MNATITRLLLLSALGVIPLPRVGFAQETNAKEDAWQPTLAPVEEACTNETFQAPAGVFKACLKTKETTPLESGTAYKLYAPGIGLCRTAR